MNYPDLDPVIFQIGPLAIRWYGMMYLLGFLGGFLVMRHVAKLRDYSFDKDSIADLLFYAVLGVVLGGRVGYTLFYNPGYYLSHPVEILSVWEGGMSFHGGVLGVLLAMAFFSYKRHCHFLQVADLAVSAVPVGLGLGRLGNFINGELWGRTTELPWGIVFPGAGPLPRHPSQLYEAFLEGVVLFVIIYSLHRMKARQGIPAFSFLFFYGIFRFIVEFVRQPDSHLGFLWWGATMGQLLSLPMIILGLGGLVFLYRRSDSGTV